MCQKVNFWGPESDLKIDKSQFLGPKRDLKIDSVDRMCITLHV